MKKRLIIILIILAVLSLIGWLIYLLIKPKKPQVSPPKEEEKPVVTEGKIGKKLAVLSDEEVVDFWIAGGAEKIFYVSEEGQVAQANENKDIFLTQQPIENISLVLASPDSQKVLIGQNSNLNNRFSIFDLVEQTWTPLDLDIESISWSPDGKNLAVLESKTSAKNLLILDIQGNIKKTAVKNIFLEDVILNWIEPDAILFLDKAAYLYEGSVWSYNLASSEWKNILKSSNNTRGFLWKWDNAAGIGFLFRNKMLEITDSDLQSSWRLSEPTLPSKCAAQEKEIYCFIFKNIPAGFQLPDDYLKEKPGFEDYLYKINIETQKGEIIPLDSDDKVIDGENPQLLGDKLLFINRYDRKLYSLELK